MNEMDELNGLNAEDGLLDSAGIVSWQSGSPAPSLRVPVTSRNRDYLRWLRHAELSAWQEADARPQPKVGLPVRKFSAGRLFRPQIKPL